MTIPLTIQTTVDWQRSRDLARRFHTTPRACWRNAYTVLKGAPRLLKGACYVEGWYCPPELGYPAEHGWIELPDGVILDVTGREGAIRYIAALRWSRRAMLDAVGDEEADLPLVRAWDRGGMENEQYAAAYRAAFALCGLEA